MEGDYYHWRVKVPDLSLDDETPRVKERRTFPWVVMSGRKQKAQAAMQGLE